MLVGTNISGFKPVNISSLYLLALNMVDSKGIHYQFILVCTSIGGFKGYIVISLYWFVLTLCIKMCMH